MSFLEISFPDSISFKSSTILEFNTSIVKCKNGQEYRNINWDSNKMKFNIINGIKTKKEIDMLISFFRNVKGCGYGFRFKDWTDFSATKEIIATSDGIKNEFQLTKTYKINDNIYIRKITKPVISTVKVFINDIEQNHFNIDYTTGLFYFDEVPLVNSTIKASFEFDVPVRFDSDLLEINMNSLYSGNIKDLILIEI